MAYEVPALGTAGQVYTAAAHNIIVNDILEFAPLVGVWSTYVPVLTQLGAVTKTVNYASYIVAGKLVIVSVYLDITGTGTGNNAVTVTLPVTAKAQAGITGVFYLLDANVDNYVGTVVGASTTTVAFYRANAGNTPVGVSPNFTFANGDSIRFSVTYEAA